MSDILFLCPKCGRVLCVSDKAIGMTLPCTDCQTPVKVSEPAIRFNCVKCNSALAAFGNIRGNRSQCPDCREMILIPQSNAGVDKIRAEEPVDKRLFTIQCPACKSDIELEGSKQDWSGQKIECPKCGQHIRFPAYYKHQKPEPPASRPLRRRILVKTKSTAGMNVSMQKAMRLLKSRTYGMGLLAAALLAAGTEVMAGTEVLVAGDFDYEVNYPDTNSVTITKYKGPGGDVRIPGTINGLTVSSIGAQAFFECSGLTNIIIPQGVTSIGKHTFWNCTGLVSVTIPNSTTSIGEYSFYNCNGLTSVSIGKSVTNIGQQAFYYCASLTNVYFKGNAPVIDPSAFKNDTNVTIYYFPGTKGWSTNDNCGYSVKPYKPRGKQ